MPLDKTVADLNLEQIGRTDGDGGTQISRASVTGFDYSNVSATLVEAGRCTGIEVVDDPERSDSFFGRSDNISLAQVGVPAHTVTVTYEFPDYHAVGDEWQKLDYDNMAHVVRMLALGTLMLADDSAAPVWNPHEDRDRAFREARER